MRGGANTSVLILALRAGPNKRAQFLFRNSDGPDLIEHYIEQIWPIE